MAFISSKKVREQCTRIVNAINQMYEKFGNQKDIEFTLVPQVGPMYILTGKAGNHSYSTDVILQFNPFDVDMGTAKKVLKKGTGISEVHKNGNHFVFKT